MPIAAALIVIVVSPGPNVRAVTLAWLLSTPGPGEVYGARPRRINKTSALVIGTRGCAWRRPTDRNITAASQPHGCASREPRVAKTAWRDRWRLFACASRGGMAMWLYPQIRARAILVEEPVVAAGGQPLEQARTVAHLGRRGSSSRVLQGGGLGHRNLICVELAVFRVRHSAGSHRVTTRRQANAARAPAPAAQAMSSTTAEADRERPPATLSPT